MFKTFVSSSKKRGSPLVSSRLVSEPPTRFVRVSSLVAPTRFSQYALLSVHPVNHRLVLLGDDVALELLRGGELVARHGEVAVQDGELLDLLRVGDCLFVVRVDGLLDVRAPLRVLLGGGHRRGRRGNLQRVTKKRVEEPAVGVRVLLLAQRDEAGVVLALVADHHHVGDARQQGLEAVLDRHGRDVLTARGDDELLDAPGDAEQARVFVHAADVARVQPPVRVDRLRGLLRVVHVAHHDVAAAEAHLAFAGPVAARVVVDLDLHAGQRRAARARLEVRGLAARLRAGVLGHAVHLHDVDRERAEVVQRVQRDGRRAGEEHAALL
mmetsp:Transcript_6786/g.27704  ORF Transcript_6786/g.27704 Transcript_6786/m.27704 type:complete len:325 (-) Transcript_6786:1169-2143(-)